VHRGYLTLALWLAWAVSARAQPAPRVLLLERAELRPELCTALRIQLSGTAQVSCEPEPDDAGLPDRISGAASRVDSGQARLAVLLERDPDPRLVRMYVVGSRADQAVLTMERIEDRPGPDVDRSLALKVGAALEVVSRIEHQAALSGVLAEPVPPARPVDIPPRATPTQPAWSLFLDLGGGFATAPKVHGLVLGYLGASRVRPRFRLDLGLGFQLGMRSDENKAGSEAQVSERGLLATARALRRMGRFEMGGELTLTGAFLAAEGIAADGTRGERLLFTPAAGLGLDLRVRLFSSAYLRLSPRLDVPLIDRSLRVDDVTVIDFPSVQVSVPVSLLFYLPLSSEAP